MGMLKLKILKTGDTLIEVMFAIAVFSAVAVSVISTMNSGTSSVQNNLETTMARNAIDVQAEALRFIQSSYISEHNGAQQNYASVWKTITNLANDPTEDITKFSVNSCEELYDRNSNKSIFNQNAFIINTRGLTVTKDGVNSSTAVIKAINTIGEANNKVFTSASVYPRIMFRGENDTNLIDTNNSNILNNAEGIYVIAVRDPDSTVTVEDGTDKTEKASAYYDFYIRTCWSNSRSNSAPTTISTVIRLYNPDINVVEDKKDYDYITYKLNFDLNGGSGNVPAPIEAEDANSRHKFGVVDLPNPTRPGYTFLGWQLNNNDSGQYDRGNKTYIKNAEKLLVNGDSIVASKDKPSIVLYAVWGQLVNFTATTSDPERGTIKELRSAWWTKMGNPSKSGDSVTIQIPQGDSAIAITGPKECFVFSDWYIGDIFYTHAIEGQAINSDTELTAKFSKDITCIEKIRVLNVYPNLGGNLKSWMETNGYGKVAGKQIIQVTSIPMTTFNSNPNSIDANRYDIIVFGFLDCNNHMDLSANSRNWLQNNWISARKPIIFGHDTITTGCGNHVNFNSIANYAGLVAGGPSNAHSGTSIKIVKDSTFTTYPHNISNRILAIPRTHQYYQYIKSGLESNIFLAFNDGSPASSTNFYLTVNGTAAMIQTGHSDGAATADEQKILANLIFYLYSQYDN